MGGVAVIVRRGFGGRDVIDVDGLLVVAVRVVVFGRSGVAVVIMAVVGRRRMIVMRRVCGHGVLIVSRGGRGIAMSMIIMAVRGCGVVVVTLSMVVVRLVLVAHDSIPQPLCAVFSGESGIT